jgi:dihydrofolate reductase
MSKSAPELVLLAAVARNRVIGHRNDLPWHLPEDLRRFKAMTVGQTVAMGRKTFDAITARLGRALPERTSVVLTRDRGWKPLADMGDVRVIHHIDALMAMPCDIIFVIGGADIYRQTMPFAHRLEITEIDTEPQGDALFPEIDPARWQRVPGEALQSVSSGLGFRFSHYERRRPSEEGR